MTTELLKIMKEDIKQCEDAQSSNKGTEKLYQTLIDKYNGILKDLEKQLLKTVNSVTDQN